MIKKVFAVATALTIAAMLVGPGAAEALTAAELQAQIDALLTQIAALQAQLATIEGGTTTTVSGCTISSFDRNLKVGMTGDDVKCLQIVLNSDTATKLASSGAGSPGNETTYFGPITKAGVIKFQEKYASVTLTPWGLTAGTGFVGTTTREKLNSILSSGTIITTPTTPTTPTVPVTGDGLTVTLATDTPVSGSIVDGQGLAPLAKFTFSNADSAAAKVTQLKLKRIGVSADATLVNVYLFDGAIRITDSASVSSGIITFTDTTGIFEVASGSSKTISVKADVDGTSGETMSVALNAASDVVTGATSVNGIFPLNGNLMTLATATLAGVNFSATTTPTTNTSLTPQDNYTVWQNTVTFTTRAVDFTRISFRMIGSIKYADIQNFRLYVGGIQVGSTIQNLDSDGYITFDLSASPKRIEAGSRIIKVVADIIGGSSRDFYFSIRNSADANFTDTQYSVNVLPQSNSSTFSVTHVTAGTQTIGSGTLTVTKMSDSPSGNIVDGSPAVTLAKYELKAAGENVKIETLYVSVVSSETSTDYLRNGMLLANGVQVGSTSNLYTTETSTTSTCYTTFNLGSSLIVEPGSPVTLEVVADIYDNDGEDDIDADDTLTARLEGASSNNNALGVTSSTTVDVPATDKDGNQLTVKSGALTLAEYTGYTDRTVVAPLEDFKLAHFTLRADTTEAVNLSTIAVRLDEVSSYVSDLWVKFAGQETSHVATISSRDNDFSINYALVAGETMDIEVYGDVNSSMTSGTATTEVLVTGTTADSATTIYGDDGTGTGTAGTGITAQDIAFSTGSLTEGKGAGMPLDQVIAGNQQVTAAKFKFTAANDDYTIRKIKITVDDTDDVTGVVSSKIINNAILKDGSTVIATQPFDTTVTTANDAAYFTGLNIAVPANTSKTLTVDLDLGVPSSDIYSSQINVKLTLNSFEHANSQGSITTDTTGATAGNNMYVLGGIPVVTKLDVTKSTLGSGTTVDLYKWKVAASGGEIAIKQMKLGITWADTDGSTLELESFKFYKDNTDITSLVTIEDEDNRNLESTDGAVSPTSAYIIVRFPDGSEDAIDANDETTYKLRATAQGFTAKASTVNDDRVALYLLDDAYINGDTNDDGTVETANLKYIEDHANGYSQLVDSDYANNDDANFIWSDISAVSHTDTTGASSGDFANGYLVQSLPLSSEQWVGP